MATPTYSIGSPSATFVIMQLSGSTYFDVFNDGRSIIAVRGLVGEASGVGVFGLPPDQRFYAGGSSTVRGYRFQTLGPQFPDEKPTGGTAISTGTIEFRQRILGNYGVVGFIDAGQVTSNGAPFSGSWHEGAGIGARYYTSIGPIRLDFAVPVEQAAGRGFVRGVYRDRTGVLTRRHPEMGGRVVAVLLALPIGAVVVVLCWRIRISGGG